ncbi:MAG: hypothetical protein KBT31_06855, partial [Firmicutes bacterium]|nr:hypothetical protein [Candidatus Colimorpha enterica]
RLEQGSPKELIKDLYTAACCGIDKRVYVENGDLPLFEKYDGNVPPSLLRKAYAEDRLENVDVEKRIMEIVNEFGQH